MNLTINGKSIIAHEGETLLQAARHAKIEIPTLCYQPWAEAQGSCRLCSVEITRANWDGWKKVVTSCNHPVQDGLIVYTHSERILKIRKNLVDLLLARCPNTPEVQKLAQDYGLEKSSYVLRDQADDCTLCGLCVRACETIGAAAISTVERGHDKKINTPYGDPSDDCIGCASCANVCPTHQIQCQETNGLRSIWKRTFPMVKCTVCGRAHITEAQRDHLVQKTGLPKSSFDKCEICHKRETARQFFQLGQK